MMIWINGTFGVGKTTAGTALVDARPALRLFDPEVVGYMLAHSLKDQAFTDFQDLPAWRTLVPAVALEIRRHTGQDLVAVQTVLRQEYWAELTATFVDLGERIFHVVLDADEPTLRNRIENDQQELAGRQWRLDHISQYAAAREWMIADADLVLDTSRLTAQEVTAHIAGATKKKNLGWGRLARGQNVVSCKATICFATHRTPARIACRRVLQDTLAAPENTSIGP